jgi:hypothetical protein
MKELSVVTKLTAICELPTNRQYNRVSTSFLFFGRRTVSSAKAEFGVELYSAMTPSLIEGRGKNSLGPTSNRSYTAWGHDWLKMVVVFVNAE